jgi:transcriptional regulator with XRE-family HTH domain
MNIKQKFGKKIKELRLKAGLSQEVLANLAGLDRTYIPSIEGLLHNHIIIDSKLKVSRAKLIISQ